MLRVGPAGWKVAVAAVAVVAGAIWVWGDSIVLRRIRRRVRV